MSSGLVIHPPYHHPEASGLIRCWNGVLKTQLQHHREDRSLQSWRAILEDTDQAVDLQTTYGATPPDQDRVESDSSHSYPKNHLQVFFLSFPSKLSLEDLEVKVLKARMPLPWNISMVLLNQKLTLTHCLLPIFSPLGKKLIAEKGSLY